MSAPHFGKFVIARPWLHRWMQPIANWYCDIAGYRKLGLKADDLIPEENDIVQKALKRLPPKESYDRVFRIRRAFQCSISHQLLPKEEHIKPEEDDNYLTPYIEEVEAEIKERNAMDKLTLRKK